MGVLISFQFYGDQQVERTLDRFAEAAEDATPVWEVLADRFARMERKQFATEGAHASGGWAPLSPRYAAWKARHYPGRPILVLTGDLKESLTRRPFDIEIITPKLAIFGSAVVYGGYHQRGEGHNPRRRPVELRESERREWVKVLQRWIVTGSLGGARGSNLRGPRPT